MASICGGANGAAAQDWRIPGDGSIAVRLRMTEAAVVRARDELVAYRASLVQVLSVPRAVVERRGGGLANIGEMLRTLTSSSPQADPRRSR